MLPVLQIGPLALQPPGLMLLLGLWLGLSLAEKSSHKHGLSADRLYNLVFIVIIAAALGARLFYAINNADAFIASPLGLVSLNPDMLDPFGGLAAGLISALILGRRYGISLWPTLDALTPLFMVLYLGIATSHIASGSAFGMETSLPWPFSIELWGASRHPTQFYELLAGSIIYGLLYRKLADAPSLAGTLFLTFSTLLAASQVFILGLRGDSTLLPGGLRLEQIAAWLALGASLWGLERLQNEKAAIQHG
jgi:phosphatidylglycerol:prolipoprotein diacylglycerol transferase